MRNHIRLFTQKETPPEPTAGNNAVLGIIAPTALQFNQNSLTLGDTEAAVYAVTRYPAKVEYGWLSDVANQPGTVTEILYTPETDVEAIIRDISRTVRDNTVIADSLSGADVGERVRAEKLARDGTNIIEQIANEGESVGVMDMLVMAMGRDREDLEKRGISLSNRFLGRRFQLRKLAFLQQQAFAMISPCSRPDPLICAMTRQLIPLSSLMGGSLLPLPATTTALANMWARTAPAALLSWTSGGGAATGTTPIWSAWAFPEQENLRQSNIFF